MSAMVRFLCCVNSGFTRFGALASKQHNLMVALSPCLSGAAQLLYQEANININRKILSQLGVYDRAVFTNVVQAGGDIGGLPGTKMDQWRQ